MSASPLDLDNAKGIIHEALKARQLQSRDIDVSRGSIDVHGNGSFTCSNISRCDNGWISHFSWARINLYDERIDKRWKMKCKVCLWEKEAYFSREQLRDMADRAICKYKNERPEPRRGNGYRNQLQRFCPHVPELCEKCEWGRKECWRDYYR